jgi:hypothetical protein
MKVKVFYPNKADKIEFTRSELEKLLDEVYAEGYADGKANGYWIYSTPTLTGNGTPMDVYYSTSTTSVTNSVDSTASKTTLS